MEGRKERMFVYLDLLVWNYKNIKNILNVVRKRKEREGRKMIEGIKF